MAVKAVVTCFAFDFWFVPDAPDTSLQSCTCDVMFCLVALIVIPFVFVIVSCHCLVIVIVSYISLLSKLAHKPTKQLCIARTARTDLAMQKFDWNKVAMYCVRAFKINIKMTNMLKIQRK